MSQSKIVSSYKSHPEGDLLPLSLTIRFPHIDQGVQKIETLSWRDVLIQFVTHGLSHIELLSRLAGGWTPITNKPALFRKSDKKNRYCRIRPKLYMLEYSSARDVHICLDKLIDQLSLSHDCYEITLEQSKERNIEPEKPKMSIYAYKGVNGW